MTFPCAFEHGDGLGFTVSALANTALQAHELACHKAFTKLLSLDAGRVVLRPTSWHCTEEDIVQHFAQVLGTDMHQPLAVPEPRASRSAYKAPEAGQEAEREQAILDLLRECIENEKMGSVILPTSNRCEMEGSQHYYWTASSRGKP